MTERDDQYTPEEFLTAARNAEADGRLDYAVRFYNHLVQAFPTTPAGQIALEALVRLQGDGQRTQNTPSAAPAGDPRHSRDRPRAEPAPRPFSHGGRSEPPPGPAPGVGIDDFDTSPGSMAERLALGAQRSQGAMSASALASASGRQIDPYDVDLGPATQPTVSQSRRARQPSPSALPAQRSGFWAGRVLAACMTALGVLVIIAAIAFLAVSLLQPARANDIAALLQVSGSPIVLGMLLIAGFAMVLVGQLMSAIFVTAIETRDVARVLRARTRSSSDHT